MDFEHLFPDERETGETQMRQCHLVMLRMFKILHYLCVKHDVKYFLCSGTLKAAIVFKGFKPWDDDLDIGMTRDNYEKFAQHVVPELPTDIFFQTPETDIYFPVCHRVEAKLRDKYSSYILMTDQQDCQYHNGLMIDILVFDQAYLPHNFFIFVLNKSLKLLFKHKRSNLPRAHVLKFIAKYSPFPLVYSNSYIDGRVMIKLGANYFKQKEIAEVTKTKFEGTEAYIPAGWHNYLQRKYGDYNKLPPLEKQRGHHSAGTPNPFTPCNHANIRHWKSRSAATDAVLKK